MATRLVPALALALACAFAGCGSEEGAGSPTGTGAEPPPAETGATAPGPETGTEEAEETLVRVYLLRGETVAPAGRTVEATQAVARAAVEELLAGPTEDERGWDLASSVPEGTELLGIDVADGIATVDLSRDFESGGGSLSMTTRLAQLVFTLTQFATVEGVELLLDGEAVESIGGEGVPAAGPMRRADFEDAWPEILVESPLPGDTVSGSLTVSGDARVFEATVLVTVLDAQGEIVAEDVATAAEGAPGRGDFEIALDLEVDEAQDGTVVAASPNAAGGPPLHAFEVPVRLEP